MLLPCPRTRWALPPPTLAPPTPRDTSFLSPVIKPPEVSAEDEEAWLRTASSSIVAQLADAGALHLRGFTLPTTKPGFRKLCEALSLLPCEDALVSIGVRSKREYLMK